MKMRDRAHAPAPDTIAEAPSEGSRQSQPQSDDACSSDGAESPLEELKEDAQAQVSVAGRTLVAADIFKFVGLVAFFGIMIVTVVLLWPFIGEIFTEGGVERVTNDVREAGPAGFLILLAVQFLQIVVAFIPGEVVQIAAGMIYGPWIGALIIFVGCLVSSTFIFLLVHKLGAPFVQAMIPKGALEKFRAFERTGKLNGLVFILFLIPGLPKDVFTYLVPLTDMRLPTFVLLSNVGRLPGILLSTYAAAGLVSGDVWESVAIFAATAVVAVVALIAYNRISKRIDRRCGRPETNALSPKIDE